MEAINEGDDEHPVFIGVLKIKMLPMLSIMFFILFVLRLIFGQLYFFDDLLAFCFALVVAERINL
jgi:hypothetical protein